MERPADLQHFGFSLLKISCAVNYEFLVYVYAMVAVLNLLGQDAAQGRDVVWAGLVHGGGLGGARSRWGYAIERSFLFFKDLLLLDSFESYGGGGPCVDARFLEFESLAEYGVLWSLDEDE